MRNLCALLLCLPLMTIAQSNFEGTIVCRSGAGPLTGITDMTMTTVYGKTKVQMTYRIGMGSDSFETVQLIDFANCLSYSINHITKTYTVDTLSKKEEEMPFIWKTPETRTIAGYPVVKYLLKETEPGNENDSASTFLWISPQLIYTIPEKCRDGKGMNMFAATNYNLCFLGMGASYGSGSALSNGNGDEKDSMMFVAEKIIPGPVNEDSLIVPASYAYTTEETKLKLESVTAEAELPPPPPPPPPPPVPKKPVNKKPVGTKPPIKKKP